MTTTREPRRLRALHLAASLLALTGCADRADRAAVVERDSAGISIIESRRPVWTDDNAWTVSDAPSVAIGTGPSGEADVLYQVTDVAVLGTGDIVVVNSGAHELRIYSPDGEYVRTIGRQGSGPGEFDAPSRVWVMPHDSLAVLSFLMLSTFDSAGGFARSMPAGGWSPHDRFRSGAYLRLVIPAGVDRFQPGYFHPDIALVRSAADGPGADTLAYLPGDEMFRWESSGGVTSRYSPFGRVRMAAVHGDSIYTGDGADFELSVIDQRGETVRIIRRVAERSEVTPAAIDSLEAWHLERVRTDEQRRSRERMFREWSYPSLRPSYDRLLVDSDGNAWVRHYAIGGGSREWTVFDADGRWLGVVTLPDRLEVKRIGPDYVLGVVRDDLDVESVRLFALEKSRSLDD